MRQSVTRKWKILLYLSKRIPTQSWQTIMWRCQWMSQVNTSATLCWNSASLCQFIIFHLVHHWIHVQRREWNVRMWLAIINVTAERARLEILALIHALVSFQNMRSATFLMVFFLDVNECDEENTCKNGRCQNTDGGFWCKCDAGFNPNEDMTECIGKSLPVPTSGP